MKKLLKRNYLNSKTFFFIILGILLMYFTVTIAVESRFSEIEASINEQISRQQTTLTAIIDSSQGNGTDAATMAIIKDCPVVDRDKFDNLLGRLDKGLTNSELIELERLFGRCGSFYSESKLIAASKLSREVEILKSYIYQLTVIQNQDSSDSFLISDWEALAKLEGEQATLFSELVSLQDEIITALLNGKSADSDEMAEILYRVSEVQGTLNFNNVKVGEIRSRLIET